MMKLFLAILITVCLWALCWIASALVNFDLFWFLTLATSVWAALDAPKLGLQRFKLTSGFRPFFVFCVCYLLWIVFFPLYLWARFRFQAGTLGLKLEPAPDAAESLAGRSSPAYSRLAVRAAQGCLVVLTVLKLALTAAWFEESWRGPRVWDNYRQELAARGESLDWEALIPPPVPDSENIYSAPMMSEWFVRHYDTTNTETDLSKQLAYRYPTGAVTVAELVLIPPRSQPGNSPPTGVWVRHDDISSRDQARELIQNHLGPWAFALQNPCIFATRLPEANQSTPPRLLLEAGQPSTGEDFAEFLSGNNRSSIFAIKLDEASTFRVQAPVCLAADYLKWSDQFQSLFDQIQQALQRPYARLPGDYAHPASIPVPNFIAIRALAQTLAQRAQCHLLRGQPDLALEDLTLLNNSRRLLEAAPTGKPMTLVSVMINSALVGLYVEVVADGFRLHVWQEPQLAVLQKQLAQINLTPIVREAFHDEQASNCRAFQDAFNNSVHEPLSGAALWQKMRGLRRPNSMLAFLDLNLFNIARLDQMIIDSLDPARRVVLPQKVAEFQREVDSLKHHYYPYKIFAAIAVPNGAKALQTFAFNQAQADEAQIVCALERYRLKHGGYPDALDAMVPEFVESLPHDIIGGQPLKYRRSPDGKFVLYSIGWNETDNGGQYLSASQYDKTNGDWVW